MRDELLISIDESANSRNEKNPSASNYVLEKILRELGSVSQKCRKVSWQEARKSYCEVLTSLAEKYPVPEGSILKQIFNDGCEGFIGGDEHILIRSTENNTNDSSKEERIYKITHSENFGCDVIFDPFDYDLTGKNFHARGNPDPWLYIKRWQLLNSISDYTTRFEAIIEPEKKGWPPRICVSQPYIVGDSPSQEEISKSLQHYHFTEVSLGAYYNPYTI